MADTRLYVGVDLGGTKILASVVDAAGRVLSRVKRKTRAEEGAAVVVDRLVRAVESAAAEAGVSKDRISAVGLGVAGPVDFDKGVVLTAGNMPWTNVPLRTTLRKRLGVPAVVVDNDVNAGAYGEWKQGAGKGCDSLLGVFVGTGIGGGLVLNGELYRGHFWTAGEIGHTIIQTGGGMTARNLEDLASRAAIGVTIARSISTNHPSKVSEVVPPDGLFTEIRSGVLAEAYRAGDAVVVQAVEEAARHIGTACANAVTLLSLKRVVLGGGLTEALGAPLVKLVAMQFRADVWPGTLQTELVEGQLKDDAVVVGAALLARDTTAAKA
jgi:glucokinase